jgi:hypothetical protein
MELCPACDSEQVTIEPGLDVFPYGLEPQRVMLKAWVDLYHCAACGMIYSGMQGEIARAKAVADWLQHGAILA